MPVLEICRSKWMAHHNAKSEKPNLILTVRKKKNKPRGSPDPDRSCVHTEDNPEFNPLCSQPHGGRKRDQGWSVEGVRRRGALLEFAMQGRTKEHVLDLEQEVLDPLKEERGIEVNAAEEHNKPRGKQPAAVADCSQCGVIDSDDDHLA